MSEGGGGAGVVGGQATVISPAASPPSHTCIYSVHKYMIFMCTDRVVQKYRSQVASRID